MRKVIGAIVGVTLLGLLFAASFLGAFSKPAPHDVPVGVVGPAPVVEQLSATLAKVKPGAFELTGYASAETARQALLDRELDAVLDPQAGKLVVASAAGRTGANVITAAFQGAAQAQGRPLTVEDAAPTAPADAGGIAGMFFTLSLVIPGVALAVLLFQLAPRLGFGARTGALALGALVAGSATAWLAHSVFEVLPGDYWALAAISSGLVLTIALVGSGLVKLLGPGGVGLAALLFVVVGVPASGGPLGARYIPEWYAAIGHYLPVGPGAEAIRNVVFFDGAALAWPLTVLGVWALVGLVLLALPGRGRAAEPQPAGRGSIQPSATAR
ncbi:hypothetical protein ACIBG7_31685 [Nonomuraea sp. NPDC050328]|uniref:hypothetical protein n=1 Tax=Nonomuraea sp. NPDC050328 TaxID=3364361 RepID=UPI00379A0DF2